MKGFIILLFSILLQTIAYAQSNRLYYLESHQLTKDSIYNKVINDLHFLNLNKGDTIVDIGSYDGYYPALYSIFSDSVFFYLNDISSQGFSYFDKIKIICSQIKGKIITNQFKIIIGTDTSTNIIDTQYTTVLMRDVLHHFKYKDIMLKNIKKNFKSSGKLILFETIREGTIKDSNLCSGSMTKIELNLLLNKCGFKIIEEFKCGDNLYWFKCLSL